MDEERRHNGDFSSGGDCHIESQVYSITFLLALEMLISLRDQTVIRGSRVPVPATDLNVLRLEESVSYLLLGVIEKVNNFPHIVRPAAQSEGIYPLREMKHISSNLPGNGSCYALIQSR